MALPWFCLNFCPSPFESAWEPALSASGLPPFLSPSSGILASATLPSPSMGAGPMALTLSASAASLAFCCSSSSLKSSKARFRPSSARSIWKAVMLGFTKGFRSTSISSRCPAFFCHSFRMDSGSSRTRFSTMRIFSRSLHSPMSFGSCSRRLKETNSFCNRGKTKPWLPSGNLTNLLCDTSIVCSSLLCKIPSGKLSKRLCEMSKC
mmetsp:Transcript_15662/g.36698  ORF Transcript_15662/g.36698 Transcript_15662/m.36698 type:complete len:207 (+) Transcript_15662:1870-2490(+)